MYEYLDRRYALALYEIIERKGNIDKYIQELKDVNKLLEDNEELKEVIKHPQISIKEKKKTFTSIFKGKIDEELLSFLLILIDKDRILFLKEKIVQLEKIYLERKNTIKGIVKTTVPLTDEERNTLVAKLEKKYNKIIILEEIIDPTILGGIYLRIGNDVIDGTVKSKLDRMKQLITRTE